MRWSSPRGVLVSSTDRPPCSLLKLLRSCADEQSLACASLLACARVQVGCRHGGCWYEDYKLIGGQHRYAVDQYGGGRSDFQCRSAARLWCGPA